MKSKAKVWLLLAVFSFLVAGCSVSAGHAYKGQDFAVDQWYVLRKPAYVFTHNKENADARKRLHELGYARTPSDLDEFIQKMRVNPRVAGLLIPGDKIKIIKVSTDKSITLGEFTDVWARVMSGDAKGMDVEISGISKTKKPSYIVLRDAAYLEPMSQ